jgi:predicted  nucleic acid-binding Zn ribbon protein
MHTALMNTAQLFFHAGRSDNRAEVLEKIQSHLAALLQNGQLVGDHTPMAKVRGGFLVTASLPESGALADRFRNKWVRNTLRELAAVDVEPPVVTDLGFDPESRGPCKCRKQPFLILFTTFLHNEPPVQCGACFRPIPLYGLPTAGDAGNYKDLLWWQDTYHAIDWLFIGTGPGERFAHDQLSRHDSPLSKDGRELAGKLEKKVRLPVYYYLSKHFGRSDREERKRRCPSCGKVWLRGEPLHRIFDFQCRRCRLLSNVAFDVRVAV